MAEKVTLQITYITGIAITPEELAKAVQDTPIRSGFFVAIPEEVKIVE